MKPVVSEASFAAWATGSHLRVRRQDLLDFATSCCSESRRLSRDADLVQLARACRTASARSAGEAGHGRPADRRHRAELDIAGQAQLLDGPSAWTPIFWPTTRCFLRLWIVDDDLARRWASRPTSVSAFNDGCVGSTLKPRFGAPPKAIALPSLPIRWASPLTPPTARATSGRAFTLGSNDSSKGGAVPVSPGSVERRLAGDRGVGFV